MPRVRSTSLLLVLFIFVFALFGVQLFAGVPTHPGFYTEQMQKTIQEVEYLSGTQRPGISTFGVY